MESVRDIRLVCATISPQRNAVTVIKNYRIVTRKTYNYLKSNNVATEEFIIITRGCSYDDTLLPFGSIYVPQCTKPVRSKSQLGHMYFKLRHRYMPTVVVSFDRSMGSLRLLQALVSTIRVRVGPSGKIGTSWWRSHFRCWLWRREDNSCACRTRITRFRARH